MSGSTTVAFVSESGKPGQPASVFTCNLWNSATFMLALSQHTSRRYSVCCASGGLFKPSASDRNFTFSDKIHQQSTFDTHILADPKNLPSDREQLCSLQLLPYNIQQHFITSTSEPNSPHLPTHQSAFHHQIRLASKVHRRCISRTAGHHDPLVSFSHHFLLPRRI